jgi:flavin-dependent dehydrogenase
METPGRAVSELELFSPSGKHLNLRLDEPLAIYSRVVFDSTLRDRASKAGAQIFATTIRPLGFKKVGQEWRIQNTYSEEWSGTFLLGADGTSSIVAHTLAERLPNSEMGIAFGYRAPLPRDREPSTVLAFLPGWPGYAWAFPRLDHISFGIAISQNDFSYGPVDQLLWQFMSGYYKNSAGDSLFRHNGSFDLPKYLKDWFEPYAARVPQLSTTKWRSRSVSGKDWALVGDAAGFVDPITDEGIYFALRSAELFAVAFLEGHLDTYEDRCWLDFGRELERASKTRKRFYSHLGQVPFTERMVQFASINSGVKATLCDLISGQQQYVGLKRTLLRRALKL